MDWKQQKKDERAMLMRIVAFLFSLADLAEAAAARSPAVRALVLFILRRAENVAWKIVSGAPPEPRYTLPSGDKSVDAMRLAHRFRELATILEWQIACETALEACWSGGAWNIPHLGAGPKNALCAKSWFALVATDPPLGFHLPDTS